MSISCRQQEIRRDMHSDIDRILFSSDEIRRRITEMAAEIAGCYDSSDRGLTLVPVLSGSIIFLADLIRELPLKMKIALVQVSSYAGARTTPAVPRTLLELSGDVRGRDTLIIDDILDSGNTLRRVQAMVAARKPASLRTAVLLRKPAKAPPDIVVDFCGFDIEDLFVIGYGLDYDDHYRNYPHIAVLRSGLTS